MIQSSSLRTETLGISFCYLVNFRGLNFIICSEYSKSLSKEFSKSSKSFWPFVWVTYENVVFVFELIWGGMVNLVIWGGGLIFFLLCEWSNLLLFCFWCGLMERVYVGSMCDEIWNDWYCDIWIVNKSGSYIGLFRKISIYCWNNGGKL